VSYSCLAAPLDAPHDDDHHDGDDDVLVTVVQSLQSNYSYTGAKNITCVVTCTGYCGTKLPSCSPGFILTGGSCTAPPSLCAWDNHPCKRRQDCCNEKYGCYGKKKNKLFCSKCAKVDMLCKSNKDCCGAAQCSVKQKKKGKVGKCVRSYPSPSPPLHTFRPTLTTCTRNNQKCTTSTDCCTPGYGCFGKSDTQRTCMKCAKMNMLCTLDSDCCGGGKRVRCLTKGKGTLSRCGKCKDDSCGSAYAAPSGK